ncbi:MAG: nickel pincer cofactor biosynthesis protein LarB [Phycisphaerales bacterium]|nr:nickel pincer cofactor biosynthesis protein LarB [Phycisphaerales bacterium]
MGQVATGELSADEAATRLRHLPFEDMGFARVDHHRALRCGFPEVIFGLGKTPEQIVEIFARLADSGANVLATRVSRDAAEKTRQRFLQAEYHELSSCLTLRQKDEPKSGGFVAVAAAGTSDLPVAEEARITADIMGQRTKTFYDVGVAGIHRLLAESHALQSARVVIVVAGMEGALPSVVGGLVDTPVIAVPTSVGYGASFGGLSALLTMMNSCAAGVSVVNIDNGFGAGYQAALINRVLERAQSRSNEDHAV